MTSVRKRNANRANARASAGSRTASGKARAAHNALRHGLGIPVWRNPVRGAQIEDLIRAIAGEITNPELKELLRRFAEAQMDLIRIRQASHNLLAAALDDPNYESPRALKERAALASR